MLQKGDKIPGNIELMNTLGGITKLDDFKGKYLVVYFYPKDDTIACTKQACEFRDYNPKIEELGAKIVGVSKDPISSHGKFASKFKLNFLLLSDPDAILMKAFGTWMEKRFMGRTYMGTDRATFLIDPKGEIIRVWQSVVPLGHGKHVYETLKSVIES